MYIEGLFSKLSKACILIAAVLSCWPAYMLLFLLSNETIRMEITLFLYVFIPSIIAPVIFGLLAFSLKRITREMADNQRAVSEEIKELKKQIQELQK